MEFTDGLTWEDRDNINTGIKKDYKAVLNYNFGAEYSVADLGLKLRAGFMYMNSPFDGDPSEYDKKIVSGGIGIPINQLEIDLGVSYGWWKDFGYNYNSALSPVNQDLKSTTLMATMKYAF